MSFAKHNTGVALLAVGLCLSATSGVYGIIEGPDPISAQNASENAALVTGRPAVEPPGLGRERVRNPRSGHVVEVWAARASDDHDIALAEWDGQDVPRVVYLTAKLTDDLDPRAAFDTDGALHVVWWSRGERDEIVHARRDAVSSGWSPDRVVAQDARRPALAVVDGRAWLAFERTGERGTEIVLAEPGDDGGLVFAIAARSSEPAVAGLTLRVVHGRPHVEWTEGEGRVVRVERWGSAWIRHDAPALAR